MRVLAIDTATTDLVTGIVDTNTGAVTERIIADTRAHNEQLVPTVQALLSDASLNFNNLDAIVVGCGPGPFTGLRVGMASAQALGQALGIPVHGVCSHDAIAHAIAAEFPSEKLLVTSDARRKEVYFAVYDGAERTFGPEVIAPEQLSAEVNRIIIPDALAARLPVELADLPRQAANPRPAGLVAVADLDSAPKPLVPLYLRRPDAKEPKARPQSPAIPKVEL